jgi:CRISPR-associated exonuclease Cas4
MISLTPSHLIEHCYCPRYTYFQYVLNVPQYEDKYSKVIKGRGVHDLKLIRNKGYLRKRLGVVDRYDDQYLTGEGLRGILDEVLDLGGGRFAPLDYKFAEWKGKVHPTYRLQLTAYSRLITANFNGRADMGYLVYVRSRNHVEEVPIGPKEHAELDELIAEVRRVVEDKYFPRATRNKQQCVTCTFRNLCVR